MSTETISSNSSYSSGPLSDIISIGRNVASGVKDVTTSIAGSTAIAGSAIAGGVLGLGISLGIVKRSVVDGKVAWKCGDSEGIAMQALNLHSGLAYAGVSGLMTTSGVMGVQSITVPAAIGSAFTGLGFAMYGAMLIQGSYGMGAACKFSKEMNSHTENKEILKWIESKLTLSEEEKSLPEDVKAKLLKKKESIFAFRTSKDCAAMVAKNLSMAIDKPDSTEASELILSVKKANYQTKVKHVIHILIAILGLATCVAGMLCPPMIACILFAVGAGLWLTVDSSVIHTKIVEKCWEWHHGKKKIEDQCQKTLPRLNSQSQIS